MPKRTNKKNIKKKVVKLPITKKTTPKTKKSIVKKQTKVNKSLVTNPETDITKAGYILLLPGCADYKGSKTKHVEAYFTYKTSKVGRLHYPLSRDIAPPNKVLEFLHSSPITKGSLANKNGDDYEVTVYFKVPIKVDTTICELPINVFSSSSRSIDPSRFVYYPYPHTTYLVSTTPKSKVSKELKVPQNILNKFPK